MDHNGLFLQRDIERIDTLLAGAATSVISRFL